MATKEDRETLRLLVQHVSRAFYEPKFTIILDQLARYPVLKDDELAGRMGLQPKELNKIIAVLSNDKLVEIHRQNELKDGAQRSVAKQYYFIDYERFCNVVKWRIAKMRHKIDSTLRNELDNKGYICTQCKTSYSPLDVDKLMDFSLGLLICEICRAEVVDNENAESVQGSKDRMQRFNHQMRFIRAGLQKSEGMVLPAFDAAAWVKANQTEAEKARAAQAGGGLKIAGSDPNKKEDEGIGVVISTDKDEATRKLERDAEAEMKRQQNALPAWHLKSTISGDLTALGVKETARADAANNVVIQPEDILKGLGRVRPDPTPEVNIVDEEVKPVVNHESVYYDQYYASLAASAQATPAGSTPIDYDDPPDDDDDEDHKPSIEYLDSLNDYRKRSRSREDEGPAGRSKLARPNGVEIYTPAETPIDTPMDPPSPEDDPLVYVNGTPKPYSTVTEEDHELMTPDEYTAYFEVMQERS